MRDTRPALTSHKQAGQTHPAIKDAKIMSQSIAYSCSPPSYASVTGNDRRQNETERETHVETCTAFPSIIAFTPLRHLFIAVLADCQQESVQRARARPFARCSRGYLALLEAVSKAPMKLRPIILVLASWALPRNLQCC